MKVCVKCWKQIKQKAMIMETLYFFEEKAECEQCGNVDDILFEVESTEKPNPNMDYYTQKYVLAIEKIIGHKLPDDQAQKIGQLISKAYEDGFSDAVNHAG